MVKLSAIQAEVREKSTGLGFPELRSMKAKDIMARIKSIYGDYEEVQWRAVPKGKGPNSETPVGSFENIRLITGDDIGGRCQLSTCTVRKEASGRSNRKC